VPWRSILAAVGVVLTAAAGIAVLLLVGQVLLLLVTAGFFAVMLNPIVDGVQRRVRSRVGATAIVFTGFGLAAAALAVLFVGTLASTFESFLRDLPGIVRQAQTGHGPVAEILRRFHLEERLHVPDLRQAIDSWVGPALRVVAVLVTGVAALVLLSVLTFMMLLELPRWSRAAMAALPPATAERTRRIARDIGHSVSGYVIGNLVTSVIAAVVVGLALLFTGVPFALLFAVWVALVDFLPQIGGLLAAVPTVLFATAHSPQAGAIVLITFLVYQQIENHALAPMVMARTVRLRPLWVLVSVLVGAELLGLVGALLAVPVAAAVQIVAQDIWRHHHASRLAVADSASSAPTA
jgi:predicted PurR-regulated permease PerM